MEIISLGYQKIMHLAVVVLYFGNVNERREELSSQKTDLVDSFRK